MWNTVGLREDCESAYLGKPAMEEGILPGYRDRCHPIGVAPDVRSARLHRGQQPTILETTPYP
jgi:hypothetical protein